MRVFANGFGKQRLIGEKNISFFYVYLICCWRSCCCYLSLSLLAFDLARICQFTKISRCAINRTRFLIWRRERQPSALERESETLSGVGVGAGGGRDWASNLETAQQQFEQIFNRFVCLRFFARAAFSLCPRFLLKI